MAFIYRIHLTVAAGCSFRALARVTIFLGSTCSTILARVALAIRSSSLAIFARELFWAQTAVLATLNTRANSAVVTRTRLAIHHYFTVAAHVARVAIAFVVVHQLYTVQRADGKARIRKTFIDVTFASRTNEARWADALEAANSIHTSTPVMASTFVAIVDVVFAQDSFSAMRT